jgi:hypothetical protein
MLLACGILFGYILLPVLLVEMDIDQVMDKLPKYQTNAKVDKSNFLRPVASDKDPSPPRTLETDGQPADPNDISHVEKRLVEDRTVLSRQSLPTARTPYIMKTASLPDHSRKKILVTGGAGFVGSHLVDKLMMEGHEVTVIDNFFTGQRKNVAHWLHHPNFRYVCIISYIVYSWCPLSFFSF